MTDSNTLQPIEQLIANRATKLEALRTLGVEPFPGRFRVETSIRALRHELEDATAESLEHDPRSVRVAGRIRAQRGHGKVSFVDISDGAAQIQLYLRRDRLDESAWNVVQQLDLGDYIGVEEVRNGEFMSFNPPPVVFNYGG